MRAEVVWGETTVFVDRARVHDVDPLAARRSAAALRLSLATSPRSSTATSSSRSRSCGTCARSRIAASSASKSQLAKGARSRCRACGDDLQGRRLARARVLRHVRHPLRRPPRPAPHPDVGAVQGRLSAAEGFPAARPLQPLRAAAPGARGESRKRATRWRSCSIADAFEDLPDDMRGASAAGEKTGE